MNNINRKFRDQKHLVIPVTEGVIFPFTEVLLNFDNPQYIDAVEKLPPEKKLAVFSMQKKTDTENILNNISQIATICEILHVFKNDSSQNVLIRGIARVKIVNFLQEEPFLLAKVSGYPEIVEINDDVLALQKLLLNEIRHAVNLGKIVDFMILMNLMSGDLKPLEFAYRTANILELNLEEKQQLLEINSLEEKLKRVHNYLAHEIKVLEIEKNITAKTEEKLNKVAKETLLRERLETIEQELGEKETSSELSDYKKKILEANMPVEIRKRAETELSRLQRMPIYNPETSYIQAYLTWLTELPWSKVNQSNVNIKSAEKILNQDHYGLEKVKERVLEYLAVVKLKNESNIKPNSSSPNILCFAGPPGVGKTSIGRSIAKALNRNFVSISLGGIKDEAEIKGHRRTYVGALPGRIIQSMRLAGTRNPVFMMDEIDKVGSSFLGNPAAALLEVLDPEQNYKFSDNYLEVPFDLSQVFFITTCNITDTIPPALKDRLEIIDFSGYTEKEKFHIAKKFLIKKQLKANGLDAAKVELSDKVLNIIIEKYTREAGVRNLEREIAKIFRKVARKILEQEGEKIAITQDSLKEYLGPERYKPYLTEKGGLTGIMPALAWSEVGGIVLFVEVALMPGKGNLILTGQLGDVMKESCRAALSYVRSHAKHFGINEEFYKNNDIHIHVPEGAVPKDGPSAGIAIIIALVSALTGRPIKNNISTTGEITLRGRVLPVGGIKEKLIAAKRAGLKKVILSKDNKIDVEDISDELINLNINYISEVEEALKIALDS